MKKIFYLSFTLVCLFFSVRAQVPQTLTYQGFLTDASGNPEQNPVTLVFNIYDGATSLYTATLNSVPISKGLFTVVLGKNEAGNPIIPVNIWSKPLKVGIAVNGGTELPQIDLTVVPYAFMASNVDNIHVQDLADGSLTGTKVDPVFGSQNISTTGTITGSSFSGNGASLTSLSSANLTGAVAVDRGGTGATSLTGVLFGNGASSVTGLSSSGANQYLRRNAANNAYEFGTLSVSNSEIADGTIVNADINGSAAIADTKLATITTTGKVSNSATTATNANTSSTIVLRDASGNFSAGTITATLNGNASTVTTNANLTGDVTSSGNATSIAAGVIVDADINTSAGIVDTKLATISTAGKVSGNAITSGTIGGSTIMNTSGGVTAASFTGSGAGLTSLAVSSAEIDDNAIVNADINASAAIVDTKLATISTAGKVSGGAVTSGTISGTTALNTSGSLVSTSYVAATNGIHVGNTTAPTTGNLEVDGYSKFGGSGVTVSTSSPVGAAVSFPAVRVLKVTGTCAAADGTATVTFSGLNDAKIISIQVIVDFTGASDYVQPGYTNTSGLQFNYFYQNGVLSIKNITGNSASLAARPFKAIITYEE